MWIVLFKRNKVKEPKLHPNTTDTLIGEGTIIEGKMISEASLRIEGRVMGDIECAGDIWIGEGGEAHSHLVARSIINAGKIYGTVQTKGLLMVTSKGLVKGEIRVGSLQIAEGAIFEGSSYMDAKPSNNPKPEPVQSVKGNSASKQGKPERTDKEKATAAS